MGKYSTTYKRNKNHVIQTIFLLRCNANYRPSFDVTKKLLPSYAYDICPLCLLPYYNQSKHIIFNCEIHSQSPNYKTIQENILDTFLTFPRMEKIHSQLTEYRKCIQALPDFHPPPEVTTNTVVGGFAVDTL